MSTTIDERVGIGQRFTRSALSPDSAVTPTNRIFSWLIERAAASAFKVDRIPFADLDGWSFDPETGNLAHDSGRFFSIEGLTVRTHRTPVSEWTQPIIVQPEIGVLGILVKEFNGVLHCLMQAKMEPGNINTVQLSPTVQATRSNYTGVHRGSAIRYLEYMRPGAGNRVLVDVLQSEQGSWFLHKRNRNMVVETTEDVPVADDYRWLTIGQITQLLHWEDIVNMDARTVLSCMPLFPADVGQRHSMVEVLSWLTEQRARHELVQRRVPLVETESEGWHRSEDEIYHDSRKYFTVVAVDVQASSREVASWRQPLVAPVKPGLLALLTRRINGAPHALVQARVDAGSLNGAEMAPTVHCQPVNYHDLPDEQQPRYLSYVLTADPAQVRYDVIQSEEGGRFFKAQNRYMVVEVDEDFPVEAPEEYRWMTLSQLTSLLAHSNYLNVELRSLIACARTLW